MADKECPNCGRKTRQEASFCLGCGQSFGGGAARRPAVERRPAPERQPAPERRPAPEREPVPEGEPPSRYEPQRRQEPPAFVPRPPASGKRLTTEQRRDLARQRVKADDRARAERPRRRFRPQRIEFVMAAALLPVTVFLALMVGIFISNVVDWLKQDEGADSAEFVVAEDFDAGRLLTVGMTQAAIDSTTFEGVAGWRVIYLEEASAQDATVSAGDVHLTTHDSNPVRSPYYMMVAFPKSGTGAVPVAAFLKREDKTVFHVMGISCENALAAIENTNRRGPPPGSIC